MPVANHERPVAQLELSRTTKRRISNLWCGLLLGPLDAAWSVSAILQAVLAAERMA